MNLIPELSDPNLQVSIFLAKNVCISQKYYVIYIKITRIETMKKLLGLVFLMFILISFTESTSSKPQSASPIDGTWELVSHYNYDGTTVTDTIPASDGYRQIKMYNGEKVMWTRYVPKDSVEWFGYGSYTATDETLTETLEYGSASMMKIVDTLRVFTFALKMNGADSFSQISVDDEGMPTFSENYRRLN